MADSTVNVTSLLDDFNRTNEDPVDGGIWQSTPGWVDVAGDTMKIVSNEMTSGSAAGTWVDSRTTDGFGAVQVKMTLTALDANKGWGLVIKMNDGTI